MNNNEIRLPFQELEMPFSDDDAGNRDRFVAKNKDKCKYITEIKSWVIWDGTRWRKCDISEIHKLADETAKSIYIEARDCENSEGKSRLSNWACKSHYKSKLENMISMASRWPEMTASVNDFDTDPDLINCLNGVVHLPTGEITGHNPSQRHLKICKVEYRPYEKCKIFDQFLNEIFLKDKNLLSWVQKALGYQLTGQVTEQVFFSAYGTGANGKSTLYETIISILGDYAGTMDFDVLLAGDKSNVRTMEAVGNLQGKRMVIASEVDSSKRLSESLIKKLTGGDTLRGSSLYGGSYEFFPQHKINLLANHMPYTKDASYGMKRRVKIIPFKRKFSLPERDSLLSKKLEAEAQGIFAWLVRGAGRWYKEVANANGKPALKSCSAVEEATENYLWENDTFRTFLIDCTSDEPSAQVSSSDLYAAYEAWSSINVEGYKLSRSLFAARLQERGYDKKRTSQAVFYLGLSLKPEAVVDF